MVNLREDHTDSLEVANMHGFHHTACTVCVILVLLALTPTAVFASEEVSLHSSVAKARFRVTMEASGSTSPAGEFLDLGVRGVYQPRLWGAGLEIGFPWSAGRGDSYALLDAMVLYGWLGMGVGASMMMTAPRPASLYVVPPVIMPYGTFGVLIPGFKVGPGRLGLNFSFDILATAIPKSLLAGAASQAFTTPSSYPGSQLFGAAVAAFFAQVTSFFKLTVGLNYSFGL
jgi:hypothetical protein